jgi:hypothetical protein
MPGDDNGRLALLRAYICTGRGASPFGPLLGRVIESVAVAQRLWLLLHIRCR